MEAEDRFSGFVKNTEGKSVGEWMDKQNDNPVMKELGLSVVNKTNYSFFKFMTFIGIFGILILGILLVYYGNQGMFKTTINQTFPINTTSNFNATINNHVTNDYSFNPEGSTTFNNYTININVKTNCTI